MKSTIAISAIIFGFLIILVVIACNNSTDKKVNDAAESPGIKKDTDIASQKNNAKDTNTNKATSESSASQKEAITEKPLVLIYNFYITNRCASCIAIEEATTKTLNTYFASEMKSGRIRREVLNVDEDANKTISEKYQAFGSGLFVTRSFKGKETTADLTGTGFKYAKNKEEKFIELLKKQIEDYLK